MNFKYILSFPDPHTHYVEVQLHIYNCTEKEIQLKMAAWTPGSYLIRDFAKNIDFVEYCTVAGSQRSMFTRMQKSDKNTWVINTKGENEFIIKYKTYCFENSVRTNYVDDAHALINGAPTFIYINGQENTPTEIEIIPFEKWNSISTSLPIFENNKWRRTAANLDELIDSPIEIGNHLSYFFEAADVQHEVAIYGQSNCNAEKLIDDLKKIATVSTNIFGGHPCKQYVFIIHHTEQNYGGLEHLHSSVNHIARWGYEPSKYQRAISLLSHEYFHLWNVKRIRPLSLGPFNYQTENYTDLLWFFEGITSYYDDYICYKAGITSQEDYLNIIAKNISGVINTAGIDTQSLSEASLDTWLKYYRKNENTNNTQVSYYNKGAVIAIIFDFIIMDATNGTKCLDDVLQQFYSNYISAPEKGITEKDIIETVSKISGVDFQPIYQKYIHTISKLPLERYFELAGIHLTDTCDKTKTYLGLYTSWKEGKLLITELDKNYGAYQSGLNVHDEIISIDGFRVFKEFTTIYSHKKPGDSIDICISRKGLLSNIKVTLSADNRIKYNLQIIEDSTEKQSLILKKWLKTTI